MGLALAMAVLSQKTLADPPAVNLGSASGFAVLAGSGITVVGATTISGNLGTFPTPAITGLENVTLNGVNHAGDAVTQAAKTDLGLAYGDAAGRTPTVTLPLAADLGGQTLVPGVYSESSSIFLTGDLQLDAQGDPDAVWVFQAGSTLITATDSKVELLNGALASHVFWQVGSSATLGANTAFAGGILAFTTITLQTGASVDG